MLNKSLSFIEQFFWTMVWIFIILIVGFYLLALIQNKFGGNVLGNLAGWIQSHAEPQ